MRFVLKLCVGVILSLSKYCILSHCAAHSFVRFLSLFLLFFSSSSSSFVCVRSGEIMPRQDGEKVFPLSFCFVCSPPPPPAQPCFYFVVCLILLVPMLLSFFNSVGSLACSFLFVFVGFLSLSLSPPPPPPPPFLSLFNFIGRLFFVLFFICWLSLSLSPFFL